MLARLLPESITLDVQAPGPAIVLEVEDAGGGVPEDVLPHIFEPFFTTKEVGKGTGLGLATVFGAVQQLGGAIEVDNRPGDGVTFRVRLPRRVSRRPRSAATRARPATTGD